MGDASSWRSQRVMRPARPPEEPAPPAEEQPDAGEADAGEIDAGRIDAGADAGEPDAGETDAGQPDAGSNCLRGAAATLAACLEEDGGPDPCLARLDGGVLCDSDGDGLSDDLEAALAAAYLPAFAFNSGASGGSPETHWPANVAHFAERSRLVHRAGSDVVVDRAPTLATLGDVPGTSSPDAGGQDEKADAQPWLRPTPGRAARGSPRSASMLRPADKDGGTPRSIEHESTIDTLKRRGSDANR